MKSERIKAVAALASAALLAFSALVFRGEVADTRERILDADDIFYLPPSGWMKAFCLGYNEVAADFLWSTTLVYFGGKKHWKSRGKKSFGQKNQHGENHAAAIHTVRYLDLVSKLDPRFRGVYRDGGRLTLYHTGRITKESVKTAISLMEKGVEVFPEDGDITFTLGFLHYYEMPAFISKKKEETEWSFHRAEGVRLMRLASTLSDAPPYTSLLSTTLLQKEDGGDEIVAEHLKAMLLQETNPSIRKSLKAQLRKVLGALAEQDIVESEALRSRWKKELSNVSFDLFLLTRPSPPIFFSEIAHPSDGALYLEPEERGPQ